MIGEDFGDIWVCQDCYYAHHYGAYQQSFLVDVRERYEDELDERLVPLWFAGEDDEPVGGWYEIRHNHTLDHNREPLGLIGDFVDVTDHTCSNHYYMQSDRMECPCCDDGWIDDETGCDICEADGELQVPCEQCGSADDENGIQEFSHSCCHGCGSPLGGSRYRLHLWKQEEVTA